MMFGFLVASGAAAIAIFLALGTHDALSGPLLPLRISASLWLCFGICRGMLPSPSGADTLARSLSIATVCVLAFLLVPGTGDWRTGLTLAAVTSLVAIAVDLAISLGGGRAPAGAVTLGAFALFLAAPIWLGQLAVQTEPVRTAVIWSNPFVHLSVQAGVDLFRTDLLYGVSPIADVRYSYPGRELALLLPASAILTFSAFLICRRRTTSPA